MRYVEEMRAVLASLGLSGHKDFEIDCETLQKFDGPGAKWIWTVERFGTNLFRVGVHEKESAWAKVEVAKADHVYLLENGQIRPLSKEQAETILNDVEYNVRDNMLFRRGEFIANVFFEQKPSPSVHKKFVVEFVPARALRLDELTALRYVALGESVSRAATVFCKTDIYVGNLPLMQSIEDARSRETGCAEETDEDEYVPLRQGNNA